MTPLSSLPTRRLGRTDLAVTEVGLGAMDTPTSSEGAETLRSALDLGINLVDTARDYAGSEFLIGQLVRERGAGGFHLCSKTFSRTVHGSQRDVDRSLSVLGTGEIDIYMLHDISTEQAWNEAMGEGGALEGLKVAQFRGLIRFIGVSSHSLEIVEAAILSGEFDVVMLEYSAFYPESARLIALAAERDIGVIVMRPVGGSGRASMMRTRIAEGYSGPLRPANLLRYVLSNEGVSAAIPGARFPSRVRENVAVVSGQSRLTVRERAALESAARELY